MRLIDADALLNNPITVTGLIGGKYSFEGLPLSAIRNAPTIDAVPVVHGKWIDGWCSVCEYHAPHFSLSSAHYNSAYCPNCGAKMDGGKKD